LKDFGLHVQVADPMADPEEVRHEYGIEMTRWEDLQPADAVLVAVAHSEYKKLCACEMKRLSRQNPVLIDVKGIYAPEQMQDAGIHFWRL
jgi:UDP-N-acetyl-D-glucosamine/UDP-N-acetyl-D-galactosamine dehydrogenase